MGVKLSAQINSFFICRHRLADMIYKYSHCRHETQGHLQITGLFLDMYDVLLAPWKLTFKKSAGRNYNVALKGCI